jgi:hypothetical protein
MYYSFLNFKKLIYMESFKKITALLFLLIVQTSCKSYYFNRGLEKVGAFKTSIKLIKLKSNSKEVVFFPMRHIATEEFYNDVKSKIDSLNKLGYYFFYESLNVSVNDTITLRKYRKVNGLSIPKPGLGYMYMIDSVYKFKLKKKMIDQPKYKELGIDSFSGKRVDLNLKDIIKAYESEHGEIKLESCDYQTSVYEKSICHDKKIDQKTIDNLILTLRNQKIVDEIYLQKRKKIAMIYGEEHFIQIKGCLLSNGFKLSN